MGKRKRGWKGGEGRGKEGSQRVSEGGIEKIDIGR